MEQTDTRERHGNAIFIASFNHMVIAYRTTRLGNVIYSTLMDARGQGGVHLRRHLIQRGVQHLALQYLAPASFRSEL